MIVLILDNASASLKGELTRWLIQIKPGVFVGKLSARVRDKLWEKITSYKTPVNATLVYSSNTDQGFKVLNCGHTKMEIVDFDGYILTRQ
jgi:CRISPR-associated protein Cas2